MQTYKNPIDTSGRPSWTDEQRDSFILNLPKAELHVHFEGSIFPESRRRIAARNQLALPESAFGNFYDAPGLSPAQRLTTFLELLEASRQVLVTRDDFRDALVDLIQALAANGTQYAEIFFDPQAHTSRSVPFGVMMEGLIAGRDEGQALFGIKINFIMCFHRYRSTASALEILKSAEPYEDDIIGLGLDDHEGGDWVSRFVDVFAEGKARGYRLTAHCDVDQPDAAVNMWRCIRELGVERIDHGLNALDDRTLLDHMVNRRIPVTTCPTWHGAPLETSEFRRIRELHSKGVLASLNSDDPGLFDSGMIGSVISTFARICELTAAEVADYARSSFHSAWISDSERARYLRSIDDYSRQFPQFA